MKRTVQSAGVLLALAGAVGACLLLAVDRFPSSLPDDIGAPTLVGAPMDAPVATLGSDDSGLGGGPPAAHRASCRPGRADSVPPRAGARSSGLRGDDSVGRDQCRGIARCASEFEGMLSAFLGASDETERLQLVNDLRRLASTLGSTMSIDARARLYEELVATRIVGLRRALGRCLACAGQDAELSRKLVAQLAGSEGDARVTSGVLEALAGVGAPADVAALKPYFRHDAAAPNLQVLETAGRIGGEQAEDWLLAILGAEIPPQRAGPRKLHGASLPPRRMPFESQVLSSPPAPTRNSPCSGS